MWLIPKGRFAGNIRMCPLMFLPFIMVDSVSDVDFFLFGQEGVFGGIAHRQQAGEHIAVGSPDYLLDFFRLITHRDVEHCA